MNDTKNSTFAQSPYLKNDTYRLTRAIWWAYYRRGDDRHTALLAEDIPPVYRRLFDAILEGSKGLARLWAEGDDDALELLRTVTNLKRPASIPLRRPALPDDLASAIFAGLSDKLARAIAAAGPGDGDWPGEPSHTCAAREETGTALVFRPSELIAARMFNPTWHTCPACYHKRVKRIALQVLKTMGAAGGMTWAMLDGGDYQRWAANIRQHRKRVLDKIEAAYQAELIALVNPTDDDIERIETANTSARRKAGAHYRAHPQADGRYFVMSTMGLPGESIPTDRRAIYELIHPYVNTPDGRRASASRNFGGDYKRLRGDGRGAGVRMWTDSRLETVGAALGARIKPGRDALRVSIDQYDAFQRLANAGIVMRACKGEGPAVMQLARAEDVTLKVHTLDSDSLYLKRDDDDDDAPPASHCPMLQPTLYTEEVPKWPT